MRTAFRVLYYIFLPVLFIWQLPQHLVACFIFLVNIGSVKRFDVCTSLSYCKTIPIYKAKRFMFGAGVSLGMFIFLDSRYNWGLRTVLHEHGHRVQSLIFGPVYLIVIGLPSVIRNIYSRCKGKSSAWYYSGYPEKWADKLGGVKDHTYI